MAVKLYPPMIEGTLPAFCGTELSVPFSMNRAVGTLQIAGFILKLKTVSGSFLGTFPTINQNKKTNSPNTVSYFIEQGEVSFDLSSIKEQLNEGQYYKAQIAYIDIDNTIGYYSTVGVVKYTTQPKVYIEGLSLGEINQHNYSYIGVYSQEGGDSTEKMYSYRFLIYKEDGSIFIDSGEKLHSATRDEAPDKSIEEFFLSRDLELGASYYLKLFVTTTNNMKIASPRYRLVQRQSMPPEIHAKLIAKENYDEGGIILTLEDKIEKVISGLYLISRASSKNGYVWEEFRRFNLQSLPPEEWSIVDYTVEQGVTYRYSIQQYNLNKIYSDRIISNSVYCDYEDSFLYDGERQLKIRFNPKVSSFSNVLQEAKVETIGSKHPFIIRNGNVNYKNFSISGLVSYQMDEAKNFLSKYELGPVSNSMDLTSDNIYSERIFKLKVLEWLSNGKPKLFRSPVEGNYIVRLLNVNLNPIDGVGRMLHNFNTNAVEIADFNHNNLKKYGLIDLSEKIALQTRWNTIDLSRTRVKIDSEKPLEEQEKWHLVLSKPFYSIKVTDMRPGGLIKILESDGRSYSIQIGATGSYEIHSENPLQALYVYMDSLGQGLITYEFKTKATNVFNLITETVMKDIPCYQHIGETVSISDDKKEKKLEDIFAQIEDIKRKILHVSFIRFLKREVYDIYIDPTTDISAWGDKIVTTIPTFYKSMECRNIIQGEEETDIVTQKELDPLALYHIRMGRTLYNYSNKTKINEVPTIDEGYIVDRVSPYFAPYTDYYYDPYLKQIRKIHKDLFKIYIDNEIVDIEDTHKFILSNIGGKKPEIKVENGIIYELSGSSQIITYSFEEDDPDIATKKKEYLDKRDAYLSQWENEGDSVITIEDVKTAYKAFIDLLESATHNYREENGMQ